MTNEDLAQHITSPLIALMVKGQAVIVREGGEEIAARLTRGLTSWKLERNDGDGWVSTGVLIDE